MSKQQKRFVYRAALIGGLIGGLGANVIVWILGILPFSLYAVFGVLVGLLIGESIVYAGLWVYFVLRGKWEACNA